MSNYEYLDYTKLASQAQRGGLADYIQRTHPGVNENTIIADALQEILSTLPDAQWMLDNFDDSTLMGELKQAMENMGWETQAALDGYDEGLIATAILAMLAVNQNG